MAVLTLPFLILTLTIVTIVTNGEPAHARPLMQASWPSLNRSLDHCDRHRNMETKLWEIGGNKQARRKLIIIKVSDVYNLVIYNGTRRNEGTKILFGETSVWCFVSFQETKYFSWDYSLQTVVTLRFFVSSCSVNHAKVELIIISQNFFHKKRVHIREPQWKIRTFALSMRV